MPSSLAASTTSVPSGTERARPAMVRLTMRAGAGRLGLPDCLTSGMNERLLHGARLVEAVLLVFVAEVVHRRLDDPARGVAEAAQAAAALQLLLDAVQECELDLRTFVGQD